MARHKRFVCPAHAYIYRWAASYDACTPQNDPTIYAYSLHGNAMQTPFCIWVFFANPNTEKAKKAVYQCHA